MRKVLAELAGKKFERLTAAWPAGQQGVHAYWMCFCECGNWKPVRTDHLTNGLIRSCGCHSNIKHGHSRNRTHTPEYSSWHMMIQRTTNPKASKFELYGGRGISVCDRWRTFENFLDDMGPRPAGTSLDRVESDKGYFPGNCRWATIQEQNSHLRTHRDDITTEQVASLVGRGFSLRKVARVLGTTHQTAARRLREAA